MRDSKANTGAAVVRLPPNTMPRAHLVCSWRIDSAAPASLASSNSGGRRRAMLGARRSAAALPTANGAWHGKHSHGQLV